MCPMRAHDLILYIIFVLFRVRGNGLVFWNKPRGALVLIILFAFLVLGAQAEEPPTNSVMHLGSYGLAGSQALSANDSPISNSSISNMSINSSTINNSSVNEMPIKSLSMSDKQMDKPLPVVPVVDLSGYAKDRKSKNLTEYKNIMYPMGESRGPPAGTSGGGGSGGGGCGG